MPINQADMHDGQRGSALAIRVQGNARQTRVVRVLRDGTLLVHMRIDVEGDPQQANLALTSLLARVLSVPTSKIEIIAGENRPEKLVSILELKTHEVQDRILKSIKR